MKTEASSAGPVHHAAGAPESGAGTRGARAQRDRTVVRRPPGDQAPAIARRSGAVLLIRLGSGMVGVATLFSWWASPDRLAGLTWSVLTLVGVAVVLLLTGPWLDQIARRIRTGHLAWSYLVMGIGALLAALLTTRWPAYKLAWLNSIYGALPSIRSLSWAGGGLQPNQTGAILAVLTAFAAAIAVSPLSPRRRRRTAIALTVLGTIVVFMTGSRAALAGLLLVYFAAVIIRTRHALWAWATVVLLGIALYSSGQSSRLVGFFVHDESLDTKLASRLDIWSSALRGIQDHFFTGIGLGVFNEVMPARYPYHVVGLSFPVSQAHNLFLDIALSIGILGLVGFLLMVVGMVMLAARWISQEWSGSPVALGILGSLVVYLVFGVTDSISLSVPTSFIVWLWACSLVILYEKFRTIVDDGMIGDESLEHF